MKTGMLLSVIIAATVGSWGRSDEPARKPAVKIEFRLAQTEPADGLEVFPVEGTKEKIYLHKEVLLTNKDIASARVTEAARHMGLDVLGSLYLGAHKASSFASANRLRASELGLIGRLDAAFASDVPAVLGYGF